jgi:ABC-type multidrug transport system fused ATPase/permease subunit
MIKKQQVKLTDERTAFKPFAYPWAYNSWLQHEQSHWIHTEVPMLEDVKDWKNKLSKDEKNFLTHVFRFFTQGDIDVAGGYVNNYLPYFPQPEVRMMLLGFAAREALHIAAYSHLIETLGTARIIEDTNDHVDLFHKGFQPDIRLENVSFTYPDASFPAVENVSLWIPSGKSVAFVGPSGAGKTTIIDILLGVLNPGEGFVEISGMSPKLVVTKWPGAISYVPQDVVIAKGTIRENVGLGYPLSEATDELVKNALKVAQLAKFVDSLPDGIDSEVGERGTKISGGQRQRLGIARAMFTCPHLLVLDEATSSLDGETEAGISEAIFSLRGVTTVLMIAHRLSTVRNADMVVYMDRGRISAVGTFDEVRSVVPNFDFQAKLMGL